MGVFRKINKSFLKEKFNEYNAIYFDCKLKTPRFSVFKSSGCYLGCFFCNEECKNQCIKMASNVDWTEDNFKKVLVHEMIHLYIAQNISFKKSMKHGKDFFKIAKKIKDIDGLEIKKRNNEICFNDVKKDKNIFHKIVTFWKKLKYGK